MGANDNIFLEYSLRIRQEVIGICKDTKKINGFVFAVFAVFAVLHFCFFCINFVQITHLFLNKIEELINKHVGFLC